MVRSGQLTEYLDVGMSPEKMACSTDDVYFPSVLPSFIVHYCPYSLPYRNNVVGVFRGYASLGLEHERDKEGHVQMGEVVL